MGWYEALKDAIRAAEVLKDADLKQRLAAVQVECAKLAEENARLREERNEVREKLTLRNAMTFQDNVYWTAEEGGVGQGHSARSAGTARRRQPGRVGIGHDKRITF